MDHLRRERAAITLQRCFRGSAVRRCVAVGLANFDLACMEIEAAIRRQFPAYSARPEPGRHALARPGLPLDLIYSTPLFISSAKSRGASDAEAAAIHAGHPQHARVIDAPPEIAAAISQDFANDVPPEALEKVPHFIRELPPDKAFEPQGGIRDAVAQGSLDAPLHAPSIPIAPIVHSDVEALEMEELWLERALRERIAYLSSQARHPQHR